MPSQSCFVFLGLVEGRGRFNDFCYSCSVQHFSQGYFVGYRKLGIKVIVMNFDPQHAFGTACSASRGSHSENRKVEYS